MKTWTNRSSAWTWTVWRDRWKHQTYLFHNKPYNWLEYLDERFCLQEEWNLDSIVLRTKTHSNFCQLKVKKKKKKYQQVDVLLTIEPLIGFSPVPSWIYSFQTPPSGIKSSRLASMSKLSKLRRARCWRWAGEFGSRSSQQSRPRQYTWTEAFDPSAVHIAPCNGTSDCNEYQIKK